MLFAVGCSDDDTRPQTSTIKDIDGNEYKTVLIGDQEWLSENLRVTKYNNGDAILAAEGLGDPGGDLITDGAYTVYPHQGGYFDDDDAEGINSDIEMVAYYGNLYNWFVVDDERGLCPEGWHVPSDDDWTQLVNYVVAQGFPDEQDNPNGTANALKSCRQVISPYGDDCDTNRHPRWNASDTHHGFDEFGFSALPGGWNGSSLFSGLGSSGFWWSATEYNKSSPFAWSLFLTYYGHVWHDGYAKSSFLSVRCIRDTD